MAVTECFSKLNVTHIYFNNDCWGTFSYAMDVDVKMEKISYRVVYSGSSGIHHGYLFVQRMNLEHSIIIISVHFRTMESSHLYRALLTSTL